MYNFTLVLGNIIIPTAIIKLFKQIKNDIFKAKFYICLKYNMLIIIIKANIIDNKFVNN